MNKAKDVKRLDAPYVGCPTSYVVDDYLWHLKAHLYVAFADATFFFPKVGHGLLAFVVEGTLTTKCFVLSTKIRALAEWPLLSIWSSLVLEALWVAATVGANNWRHRHSSPFMEVVGAKRSTQKHDG
jgi:hypothetical protein